MNFNLRLICWLPAICLTAAILATAPACAQRDLKNIPAPDPELERKTFEVADGFEVNLFAADPLLAKPIQMNFDARGRLWVASSEVYPQIAPGQKADDKILVLEDTDNNGVADKTTVFADGLLIPTGVEPDALGGGAYVANSTELLHLTDSDGDGRADKTRIMLSGFGTEDTHHIIHTFRTGPDGALYFNQSIYIHSHIETPTGVKRLNAGGTWRFVPETMQLDVFCTGLVNHWGTAWDKWGATFHTDGAGNDGINYTFPGAVFTTAADTTRILKGLNPGSPKYCGLEIVSGRHLPDDWQGNMITCDFRAHRVVRYVPSEDGSGFAAKEMPELIKTKHVAFRPVDVKMGPDGAIYIADWYNPIIQHGEVDFRDPRRDKTHGRIWRVTAKGQPLVEKPKLADATTEQLLEYLKAPEDWTRHFAKRVLKERAMKDAESLAEIALSCVAWVARLDPKDANYEHHLLESLWTSQSINVFDSLGLIKLLTATNPHVRASAVRVLPGWRDRMDWKDRSFRSRPLVAERVADEHPRVRLEAIRACSTYSDSQSANLAMRALDKPLDRFLDFALWQTARDLKPYWLPEVQAGRNPFQKTEHLMFALNAIGSGDVVQPLLQLLKDGKVADAQLDGVLSLIANVGGAKELGTVLAYVVENKSASDAQRASVLAALVRAAEQKPQLPEGAAGHLNKLLQTAELTTAGSQTAKASALAARLAGLWKVEALRNELIRLARHHRSPIELRIATLDALATLGGEKSQQVMKEVYDEKPTGPLRLAVLSGMIRTHWDGARPVIGSELEKMTAADDPTALFELLVQRPGGASVLRDAIENRKLRPDVARVGVRIARSVPKPDEPLIAALLKSGGLSGPRTFETAEVQQILADATTKGDAARGELVYRRSEMACLKCHAIGGAGGLVGPELASIGASAQPDYLLESLLEPSKKIKENFNTIQTLDTDGKQVMGIRVRKTERELVLRDAEDREVVIPLDKIDEQKDSTTSLMPTNLVDSLTHQELVDLTKFLSELGKVGSQYTLSRTPVVRRWQTPAPTPDVFTKLNRIGLHVTFGDGADVPWVSAYSTVAGELPLSSMTHMKYGANAEPVAVARAQLEVTTPGKVLLKFNSLEGLRVWDGTKQVDLQSNTLLDFTTGTHNLIVAVNLNERKTPLRLEIVDDPQTTAKVQFISGK